MKDDSHFLLHFPVLSRADFLFFRLFGSGLGNLLFPLHRAYQAQQLQGGQLVFPQFMQLKPGPLLRGELDARAYGDLFKRRSANEILKHAQALWLRAANSTGQLRTYEGLGRHFHDLDPRFRTAFRHYLMQRYRHPEALQQTLSEIRPEDIGVHIRRGDFVAASNPQAMQGTMNFLIEDAWYAQATELARLRSPAGRVRIFTDAAQLPQALLDALNPIEIDQSPNAFHALMKMSAHGTLVASRSSFSLWAGYLGQCHTIVSQSFDLERYMPQQVLDITRC